VTGSPGHWDDGSLKPQIPKAIDRTIRFWQSLRKMPQGMFAARANLYFKVRCFPSPLAGWYYEGPW
jgi:hypothetical protein